MGGVGTSWTGVAAPALNGVHTPEGFRSFAEFGPRLGAYLIDAAIQTIPALVLVVALVFLAIGASGLTSPDPDQAEAVGYAFVAILLLGGLAAFGWAWGYRWWGNATGRPFGKRLAGIRVVREDTGMPPGVGSGFIRLLVEVALGIFSPANLIDYLWPLWDTSKQTIHDKAAGTVVVRDAVPVTPAGSGDPTTYPSTRSADDDRWSAPGR